MCIQDQYDNLACKSGYAELSISTIRELVPFNKKL